MLLLIRALGLSTITHDGVTVAKAVELADDESSSYGYKMGAELIKQACFQDERYGLVTGQQPLLF